MWDSGLRRSTKRRWRLWAFAVVFGLLVVPPAGLLEAATGPTTIDFEQLAPGTPVGSIDGARFSQGVTVVDAGGNAGSFAHAAMVGACSLRTTGASTGCVGGRFEIAFDQPQSAVTLSVSSRFPRRSLQLQLVGVDQTGKVVDRSATTAVSAPEVTTLTVRAQDVGSGISTVHLEWQAQQVDAAPKDPAILPFGVLVSQVAFQAVPAPAPALAITFPRVPTWKDGTHLTVVALISNTGSAASTQTSFSTSASGASQHADVTVLPIDPGQSQEHTIILTYPKAPAAAVQITLTLHPASGETGTSNDPAHTTSTKVAPPNTGSGTSWAAISGGAVGGVLALAAIAWLLFHARISSLEKLDWQLKASDSDPPDHCTRGKRICHRECEVDPAARRITELTCSREPPAEATLTIAGEAVDRLNGAHVAYREGRPEDAIALVAVAESLVSAAVAGWLQEKPSGARLEATIEGSTASCTFKLLQCVEGEKPSWLTKLRRALARERDEHSPWREIAHWKGELKDSFTVEVGTLEASLLADAARRVELSKTLRGQLNTLAQNWNATDHAGAPEPGESPGQAALDLT